MDLSARARRHGRRLRKAGDSQPVAATLGVEADADEPRVNPSIEQVTERHAEELMAIPGVVSVGIGRSEHGSAIIVVGLATERAAARQAVPSVLDGFEVRTEVVGTFKAR